VDFPARPLGDRPAVFEVLGDEFERLLVVQQFSHVVGIGLWNRVFRKQSLGLFQGQARSLDVRGVVRFQDQGAAAHLTDPGLGQCRGLQEPPGPLNAGSPAVIRLVIMKMGVKVFFIP